jgi:hypothetical protein
VLKRKHFLLDTALYLVNNDCTVRTVWQFLRFNPASTTYEKVEIKKRTVNPQAHFVLPRRPT